MEVNSALLRSKGPVAHVPVTLFLDDSIKNIWSGPKCNDNHRFLFLAAAPLLVEAMMHNSGQGCQQALFVSGKDEGMRGSIHRGAICFSFVQACSSMQPSLRPYPPYPRTIHYPSPASSSHQLQFTLHISAAFRPLSER